MKRFLLAALSTVLALSGRSQAQCVPTADFTSYLTTLAGVPITQSSQLASNTKYYLCVRVATQVAATEGTAAFVIRKADGFTVDDSEVPATARKGPDGLTRFAVTTTNLSASEEAILLAIIFSQCGSGPEARKSRSKQFLYPPQK